MARVLLTRPGRVLVRPTPSVPTGAPHPPLGGGGPDLKSPPTSLSALLDAAKSLPKQEQQKLLDALALATQEDGRGGRELSMWAVAVHEALQAKLGPMSSSSYGPLVVKKQLAATKHWGIVKGFTDAIGFDRLTVPERQSAYHLLATLLVQQTYDLAQAVRAPLSLNLVLNQLPQLAAIFAANFPGYVESGLGLLPFQRLIAGQRNAA